MFWARLIQSIIIIIIIIINEWIRAEWFGLDFRQKQ